MKIKKIITGVLACAMVCSSVSYVKYTVPENTVITASAEETENYTEGTYERLTYIKYSDHIEITGCDKSVTEVVIPNEIEGLPVTSIGNHAFNDCTGLTSINIPQSVTSIEYDAFSCCTGLTSITIPDSVTSIAYGVFSGCTGLTEITIPDSVTSIDAQAFIGCIGLTSITIPDSVTSIGLGAFEYTEWCNNQPDGVVYAGKVAYKYKGEMPENTEIILKDDTVGIAACAFSECTGLTSITIPDSVTSIDDAAFMCCTGLTEITIPDSVISIEEEAFVGCTGLTSITIPNSVTSIGGSAFYGCTGLTSITIKNPNCQIYDDSSTIPDTATIYGYKDSTAQAYAEENNRKFVALDETTTEPSTSTPTVAGDVTGDGTTEIADVVVIASYVGDRKNNPLSSDAIVAGDVHNTGDGLTANDVLMLQQYLAGIITEL